MTPLVPESSHPLLAWLSAILPTAHATAALREAIAANGTRIDRAYAEMLEGYDMDPADVLTAAAVIGHGESHDGSVDVRSIPFASMCAHHFLPFVGSMDVTYVPGPYIIGLGKIPRLVRCRSRRFQLQELLVKDVAQDIVEVGQAQAVKVTAVASHVCVCYRGPSAAPAETRTTYSIGRIPREVV